jgi:tRNA dimethylallyltransferase
VLQEVRALLEGPRPVSSTFARAHGLQDVTALLHGEIDRATAEERLNARTRQYARRQETWLRRLPGVHAVDGTLPPAEAAARIAALLAGAPLPSGA